MGRHKLPKGAKRERRFTIYVTDDAAKRLKRAAVAFGHTEVTEWIRSHMTTLADSVTGGTR